MKYEDLEIGTRLIVFDRYPTSMEERYRVEFYGKIVGWSVNTKGKDHVNVVISSKMARVVGGPSEKDWQLLFPSGHSSTRNCTLSQLSVLLDQEADAFDDRVSELMKKRAS